VNVCDCCRLSVRLKQAAGLKNQIMSNVDAKRDNLDSLQPKLNAVMQVSECSDAAECSEYSDAGE